MLTAPPEFPTIASFIDTMRSTRGATAVGATGEFLANQCRYQLSWGGTGPQVCRIDRERHSLSAFFRHRLCNRELSSYSSRMTRALAEDRTARRNCFEIALSSWCATGAGSRAEAVQRILTCHDAAGEELDLRGLCLTSVPMALGGLTRLRVLRLGGNRLDTMPPVVKQLRALEVLELDHNAISELPTWLPKLQALRVLSLRDNRLVAFPDAVLSLPRCGFLWIDGNRISDLPFSSSYGFECFAWGNPLSGDALNTLAYLLQRAPQAPVHHEQACAQAQQLRLPVAGRGQHGCIVSLLHAAPYDTGSAVLPPERGTGPAEAQASALMETIRQRLANVPIHLKRASNVLGYRLDLLQRWMATDSELFAGCAAAIGELRDAADDDVLAAVDDVELAVVEHLLEHIDFGIERLAETGRSVYRLRLLEAAIGASASDSGTIKSRSASCRMLLAHALDLPGQVRPVPESALRHIGMSEDALDRLRESVLRREARTDFEGLEQHMADWRPWQRFVRRRQAEASAGTTVPEGILPRHVRAALDQLPDLIDQASARTQAQLDQAQSFRLLCRLLYRIWRGGPIPALEGGRLPAQAPMPFLAELQLPALNA